MQAVFGGAGRSRDAPEKDEIHESGNALEKASENVANAIEKRQDLEAEDKAVKAYQTAEGKKLRAAIRREHRRILPQRRYGAVRMGRGPGLPDGDADERGALRIDPLRHLEEGQRVWQATAHAPDPHGIMHLGRFVEEFIDPRPVRHRLQETVVGVGRQPDAHHASQDRHATPISRRFEFSTRRRPRLVPLPE